MVEAQRILSAAGALSAQAAGLGGDLAGPLALGCLKTFAPLVLPELRRSFEKAAPAVRIRQFELDHADLLGRLLGGEIDLGLTYDLAVPPGIAFEPLAVLAPHVMLPAGHPLAARPSLTPEDLGGEAMVLLDLPYSADYFLSLFETAGQRPRIAERTADMGVLRALVANGYGFSLINTRTIQTDAPDGKRLAFVPLASGLRPLQLGLAGVEGAFARRTPSAFRDHCRAHIAARGVPGCEPGA
jgi:DNA-binding transcriptional LysR family regulator